MNKIKNHIVGGVALIFAIIALVFHNGSTTTVIKNIPVPEAHLGGTTNYDSISVSQGLITTGVNSTSTTVSTQQTLSQSDVQGYSVISITPNIGSVSLNLPASTSLSSTFLPNPGDRTNFILFNATGTAGILVGVAPSTGSLVETATSTSGVAINASSTAGKALRIEVFRKVNTDLVWLVHPFI